MTSQLVRALLLEHTMSRRSASSVIDFPWGFGVVNDEFPTSVEHNRVVVEADVDPASAIRAVDAVLRDRPHQAVLWDVPNVELSTLVVAFSGAGFEPSTEVLMAYEGPRVTPVGDVQHVPGEALHESLTDAWVRKGITPAAAATLASRRVLRERSATVEYFAIMRGGRVVSHGELYVDGASAQVESLITHPDWRDRGLARAVLGAATARAQELECSLVFLRTDAADWPQHFYRRVGFVDLATLHTFVRAPDGTGPGG